MCLPLGACDGGDEDSTSETETETSSSSSGVDEQAVAEAALDYSNFERINAGPLASAHGLADAVNVWVPSEHAAAYRALDPSDPDQSASFPAGTLIVKEHIDADGPPSGLTIMYKAEPGFDPEHDDWWWAQANLDGSLNDAGVVDYCIACHTPRADADWLFGVAASDQN